MFRFSTHLLDDLFQFGGHFGKRMTAEGHRAVGLFADGEVDLAEAGVFVRVIVAKMRAPAFFAFDSAASDRFGDDEEIVEIEGGVPAGVVFAMASDADFASAFAKFFNLAKCSLHLVFFADDADE